MMRKRFERAAVLCAFAAFPLWLPSVSPQWGGRLRMTVVGWVEPILTSARAVGGGCRDFALGVLEGPTLLEENRRLKGELKTALAHEQIHRELFEENARLRSLLGFKAKSGWKILSAQVVGREWGAFSRTFLLDKGKRHGVVVGMPVIAPQGLVGRVSEVGPSASRVALLTDPHFRVFAMGSKTKAAGLVVGNSLSSCHLTYVPMEVDLKPGESVVTAGGKSFSPGGIPIGVIQWVKNNPREMFRSAGLKLAVDLNALEEVLVVTWPTFDSGQS